MVYVVRTPQTISSVSALVASSKHNFSTSSNQLSRSVLNLVSHTVERITCWLRNAPYGSVSIPLRRPLLCLGLDISSLLSANNIAGKYYITNAAMDSIINLPEKQSNKHWNQIKCRVLLLLHLTRKQCSTLSWTYVRPLSNDLINWKAIKLLSKQLSSHCLLCFFLLWRYVLPLINWRGDIIIHYVVMNVLATCSLTRLDIQPSQLQILLLGLIVVL